MMPVLDVTIRASVLLLTGFAICATLRHHSAALRHLVLAISILSAAVVGPLGQVVPDWRLPVGESVDGRRPRPAAAQGRAGEAAAVAVPIERSDRALPAFVSVLWLSGFIGGMALLCLRTLRLVRLSARAEPIVDRRWTMMAERIAHAQGVRRPVVLLQTDASDVIATWGGLRPRVLLPVQARAWSDERIHAVLCHELAHVRRYDWIVQMMAELVRALHWFNPLMLLACRQLRRESEHACDDRVLLLGVPAPSYARHLLALAHECRRERRWAAAVPMARRSTLERRIAAMLNIGLDRRAPSFPLVLGAIAVMLLVALPVAAVRTGQDSPRPLTGSIYDSTGAVLPGVDVTLKDAQDFAWHATTDPAGQFEFPPVQPGHYVLEARLMGFRELRHEFQLKAAHDWDRAITMPVGELSETVTVSASRTPRVQPQGPTPIRVGGNIRVPMKIRNVNPVYPESMREAGLSGLVPIEAIIAVDGSVLAARVRGAHVHPDFAAAALEAVRQWHFTPTLLNGSPVEVVMNVTVHFTLAD